MSQIFLAIQPLHPLENFCHWALMIAINVSVAICQLPISQFCSFGKGSFINGVCVFSLRPRACSTDSDHVVKLTAHSRLCGTAAKHKRSHFISIELKLK